MFPQRVLLWERFLYRDTSRCGTVLPPRPVKTNTESRVSNTSFQSQALPIMLCKFTANEVLNERPWSVLVQLAGSVNLVTTSFDFHYKLPFSGEILLVSPR